MYPFVSKFTFMSAFTFLASLTTLTMYGKQSVGSPPEKDILSAPIKFAAKDSSQLTHSSASASGSL
jgi:hypothetical protein